MFTRRTLLTWLATLALLALALSACNVPSPTQAPDSGQPAQQPAAQGDNTAPQADANGQPAGNTSNPPAGNTGNAPTGSTPVTVSLDAVNAFRDGFNYWHVIGLVTNRGEKPLESIVVAVEIYDENNNLINREEIGLLVGLLMPGESAPFHWYTTQELPASFRYSAVVVGQQEATADRATLTVRNVNITRASDRVYITGELVNETGGPVQVSDMATLLFDSEGNLMSANAAQTHLRYFNPNDVGPFLIELPLDPGSSAQMAGSTFYIDARPTTQHAPISVNFLPNQYAYRDNWEELHLVGEVTNTSNRALDIRLLATIYAADDTVVDVSVLDLPLRSLSPNQTISFDFVTWPVLNNGAAAAPEASSFTIQVDPGWTLDATTVYTGLDITALDNNASPEGEVTFTGTVTNNSGAAVDDATIVVALRNAAGEAVAMGYTRTGASIAAGGSSDFEITFYADPNIDITQLTYEMEAYGTAR